MTGISPTPSREKVFVAGPPPLSNADEWACASGSDQPRPARTGVPSRRPTSKRRSSSTSDRATVAATSTPASGQALRASWRVRRSYCIERDPVGVKAGAGHAVSDVELASRLSFFLWSSILTRSC
jgi:hypothetical protein